MTERRQYGQLCGLAAALDVIGERWTLLIVRELLIGPARFNELLENLPGMGPNLLSERLRALGMRGVVEHCPVPGDGRGRLYQLTPTGESLRGPVLDLARWGLQFLTADQAEFGVSRASWGFLAVQAMLVGRPVPDVTERYEFRVDAEVFHIEVDDGASTARRGPADDPAITVTSDAATFVQIGSRMLTPFQAVVTGRIKLDGDPDAIVRCIELIGLDV
ncbi:winged helix-turn-helix transcriptional regulator [Micromonospora sp. NPDC007271]|uniref:winged helix-turn-helix transcriptional regulator n=1 Tax=Micromonospora sp. NPDC007271 TaxID=3154587 RepID=UPI0033F31FFF